MADAGRRRREHVEAARARLDRATGTARSHPAARPLLAAFESEQRAGAALLAGGLAYRFFFWLVSFGLVAAAAASFWVREDERSLESAGKSMGLSGVAAHSAASAVEEGSHARWYLLVVGTLLLVYFGIGAVRALRVTAFVAWQIKSERLHKPLRSSATFTALFLVALTITSFASWLRHQLPGPGLLFTCATVVFFLGLALAGYELLPHPARLHWSALLPGAVVAALGVAVVHLITVYYLADKLERSPKLYGVLGAATVVLLGLFLIARVIVAGLFLNATLARSADGSPDAGDAAFGGEMDALVRRLKHAWKRSDDG